VGFPPSIRIVEVEGACWAKNIDFSVVVSSTATDVAFLEDPSSTEAAVDCRGVALDAEKNLFVVLEVIPVVDLVPKIHGVVR
jgi:hypothetical protein